MERAAQARYPPLVDAPGALPRKVLHALLTLGDTDRLAGAVLRWLLDAEAEHGLGATFQERLAAFLETCDATEVAFALQSGMFPVSADLVPRANSCDLLVALAGEPRLALVSATTALREPFAVEEYRSMEATVVVLERLGAEPPGVALPVWFWTAAAREVLPRIAAGPLRDFVAQLLAHDPQAPDAASSAVDLGAAKAQHPAPPPAPPELPGPGK
ncbi:MAG: hypothetical protein D6731_19165, partial [Planctomycetota bacterium]